MTAKTIIELVAASKIYRSDNIATLAVNEINLEIYAGEFTAIVGQSGSGKSTLLSVLGLLDKLDEGSYKLGGHDVQKLSREQLADLRCNQLGFVFQFFHLLGDLTIKENIGLPMSLSGLSQKVIRQRTDELLEKVDLSHRGQHYPNQLSGGQQQRVAVARALANKPPLLLVDEPTGNLDSESGEAVLQLLAEEHKGGTTLLIVTHDHGIANNAGRLMKMHDGRLYSAGTDFRPGYKAEDMVLKQDE